MILRIVIEGASAKHESATLEQLAAANGATIEPVLGPDGQVAINWLSFSAGSYDGAPLRLETVACGPGLDQDARATLLAIADAAVFVTDSSEAGLAAGAKALTSSGLLSGVGQGPTARQLVVFAQRPSDEVDGATEPSPAEVLAAIGAPADTSAVTTTDEGGGVRYGFALAVRHGLERVRARDDAGMQRRAPTSPTALLASLVPPTTRPSDTATKGATTTSATTTSGSPAQGRSARPQTNAAPPIPASAPSAAPSIPASGPSVAPSIPASSPSPATPVAAGPKATGQPAPAAKTPMPATSDASPPATPSAPVAKSNRDGNRSSTPATPPTPATSATPATPPTASTPTNQATPVAQSTPSTPAAQSTPSTPSSPPIVRRPSTAATPPKPGPGEKRPADAIGEQPPTPGQEPADQRTPIDPLPTRPLGVDTQQTTLRPRPLAANPPTERNPATVADLPSELATEQSTGHRGPGQPTGNRPRPSPPSEGRVQPGDAPATPAATDTGAAVTRRSAPALVSDGDLDVDPNLETSELPNWVILVAIAIALIFLVAIVVSIA